MATKELLASPAHGPVSHPLTPVEVKHILFPTDLSALSRATEPYILALSQKFQARISVLHAIDIPASHYDLPGDLFVESEVSQRIVERAERTIPSVLGGQAAERFVSLGNPANLIVEFAKANQVDLIMMPTHGYGPFRRALIGSVTSKILHDARCPVWTSAHVGDEAVADNPQTRAIPESILCAVDLVPESVAIVRQAAALASSFQGHLRLAHAVEQVKAPRAAFTEEQHGWARNLQDFYIDHAREELAAIQSEAGTSLEVLLEPGPVAPVLAGLARKHRAHLLVTGRGEANRFLGGIRSQEYAIIHDAPCPVLSL